MFSRYRVSLASVRFFAGFVLASQLSFQAEPTVRIGIHQNISSFRLRSSEPFMLEEARTRSAEFSSVIAIGEREGTYRKSDLEPRMAIELDAEQAGMRLRRRPRRPSWAPDMRTPRFPTSSVHLPRAGPRGQG